MKTLFLLLLILPLASPCQESETILLTTKGRLRGTLSVPPSKKPLTVVLLIAGSGATDRDGNNTRMENNSLKMLADTLLSHGIASLRYDKRGVGQSDRGTDSEKELRVEHYVNDAAQWIELLTYDERFNRVVVAGHSEGSLVGMLAIQKTQKVAAFVSIAGPGRALDTLLREQLSHLVPEARNILYGMIDKLKQGDTIGNVPPLLWSLFRPGVQPYIISLLPIDPAAEIAKLTVPILVIQGETDVQVKTIDAEKLAAANPRAKLSLIQAMNHVLKDCDHTDKARQMDIYSDPSLPLNKTFSKVITEFVGSL